jgi:hypothetical protein
MPRVEPAEFHMKDLFIDAELIVSKDGTIYDFLGRKLFSTSFFRNDTGFGITNIEIEVNTSLQPIVSITFKDLYGKTIFGGQKRIESELDGVQSLDYSVLFDWPPPKFIFAFKGYLGKSVTWLLNLKKTSTSFNSSDGSYEIKCEFVPNQWGFFADIPMLFLLAAKPLRRERLGKNASAEQKRSITSVFDLIKIGKQVEVKTQETTKDFDKLVKKLGALKSNITTSIVGSRLNSFGETIDGIVNNIQVQGFKSITIPNIGDLEGSVNTEEKINKKSLTPSSLSKLNTYLLFSLKYPGSENISTNSNLDGLSDEAIAQAKSKVINVINENLRNVEKEIQRRVYNSSKTKLQKITIGEIFKQLAKDAAFIMGSILDYGLEGSNVPERSGADIDDKIIGKAFPLYINKDGEEVPATSEASGLSIGVDSIEMDFVRKFINAISEGIAKDLPTSDLSGLAQSDTLKTRINNAEMAQSNPYKPNYQNIASNILVRSGIVAYTTTSYDPNYPGDWGNEWFRIDNDGSEGISELANLDSENITDDILNSLSDVDLLLLKRFCRFFLKFYDRSGEFLLDSEGNEGSAISSDAASSYEYPVSIDDNQTLTFSQVFSTLNKPFVVEEGVSELEPQEFGAMSQGSVTNNVEHPLSFVDTSNYTAKRIVNNGIAYMIPNINNDENYVIVFEGNMNQTAQGVNSSKSDSELKNSENKDSGDVLGYVPLEAFKDSEGEDLGRFEVLLEYVQEGKALFGNKMRDPNRTFYTNSDDSQEFQGFLWNKLQPNGELAIFESVEQAVDKGFNDRNDFALLGDIGFTAYAGFEDNSYVFAPFGDGSSVSVDDDRAINQRVYIRRICESVLKRINKIEDEKNQVIGSVLGKAGEQENALYKQMHNLYHQWQAIAYKGSSNMDSIRNGKGGQALDVSKNLATELEKRYGGSHVDLNINETETDGLPDGSFIYEFPLQRITGKNLGKDNKPINTRNSIINIEPMYKLNADTSVLNIIQQVCTKNNFLFVPIPGNASYLNVQDIYTPNPQSIEIEPMNYFHVLFTPTPESRSKIGSNEPLSLAENHTAYMANSFSIKYGSPDNQIVSDVQVGTDENKTTAESIVNLQRLVDNENQNKKVTTDCSVLPVMEGRSYTASIEMLGNAQVYPMQFFYLENSPLFGGLYQVMKVKHSINPNNMKTNVEGIRMRFSPGNGYGSIKPITLETFEDLGPVGSAVPLSQEEIDRLKNFSTSTTSGGGGSTTSTGGSAVKASKTMVEVLLSAGYKRGTIEYELALIIGTKEGYRKGSKNRPSRNNNPGNLAWSSSFKSIDKDSVLEPPNSKGERRFAHFSTPELGTVALVGKIKGWAKGSYPATIVTGTSKKAKDYRSKYSVPSSLDGIANKGVKLSIEQFFYIYAPPSENNTESYINSVVRSLSVNFPGITRKSLIYNYLS